ncbi:MAG TPA: hypothetical protein P5077_04160 [bacterium]|nr:hypothetical protein [bacterium]
MNAKVGIAIAVVFTIVWIGVKMMSPSADEKYARFENRGTPPKSGAVAATPEFDAADSYTFTLDATGLELKGDLHDALLAEVRRAVAPAKVNPTTGPKAGKGELGAITATVTVDTKTYAGQQQAIRHKQGQMPYKMSGTLTVESATGRSSWDGTRPIAAEVAPPDEVRDGIFYDIVTKQCRELARQAVDAISKEKPFSR